MLFSADHVMAWATSIVAPPDGAMADYMASLDRLLERHDKVLLPGHGGPVKKPRAFMRGLKAHRKMRERAIVERLASGDRTIRRHGRGRSTATPIRDCTARRRCRCWRISRILWRAAPPSPTVQPRSTGNMRLALMSLGRRCAGLPRQFRCPVRRGRQRCAPRCRRDRGGRNARPSACRHRRCCLRRSPVWRHRQGKARSSVLASASIGDLAGSPDASGGIS